MTILVMLGAKSFQVIFIFSFDNLHRKSFYNAFVNIFSVIFKKIKNVEIVASSFVVFLLSCLMHLQTEGLNTFTKVEGLFYTHLFSE